MDDNVLTGLLPNDEQYIQKCEEYMKYLEEHKTRVFTAYERFFKNRIRNIVYHINANYIEMSRTYELMLEEAVRKHDESKYSDEEFNPYRIKYYPTDKEKDLMANNVEKAEYAEELFQDAWHHHCTINQHHPEFYIWNEKTDEGWKVLDQPSNEPLSMDIVHIMEMLCDWAASSKGRDDFNYINWWLSHKSDDEHKAMTFETKNIVKIITSMILPSEFNLEKDNPRWLE